ncbi:MAG: hypothetical protein DHS20C14_04220 [Phycisphaeraceae bacterium]|nr:MAG: hypothetical protein DHS20C14_04220 [Phycisphaeraceae bacterium]
MTSPITTRVAALRSGEDPLLIARVPSGWAVLNERQPDAIAPCCVLLPDPVVPALNDLDAPTRAAFMADLARLGDSILAVTDAERVNYLILCNQAPELHAHAIGRYASEDPAKRRLGPFEAYDFGAARPADPAGHDADMLVRLRAELA